MVALRWLTLDFEELPNILPNVEEQLSVAVARRIWRPIAIFALLAFCNASISAQSTKPANPNDSVTADKASASEEAQSPNSFEEEMRAKRAIRVAEKEHRETLDRAREVSNLGKELLSVFKRKHSLDRDDNKKLDRLEKLTKRVRSDAGGSEDEGSIDKPPPDLASAVARLADVSESLCSKVEKTPRQVISASVIDEANVLLELISIVRNLSR
jgi:hypothetical protein